MNTTTELWKTYFELVGGTVTPEGSHHVVTGLGKKHRVVYADFPVTKEKIKVARALSDLTDDFVALVFGKPALPEMTPEGTVKENGGVLSFTPPSGRGKNPPFMCDPRWHALGEDYLGDVVFHPIYLGDLPIRKETYEQVSYCPCHNGDLQQCLYVGKGRSRFGPKIQAALAKLKAARPDLPTTNPPPTQENGWINF